MPDFFISSKFLLEIKNIATPIEEWNDIINKNEFVVNVSLYKSYKSIGLSSDGIVKKN